MFITSILSLCVSGLVGLTNCVVSLKLSWKMDNLPERCRLKNSQNQKLKKATINNRDKK